MPVITWDDVVATAAEVATVPLATQTLILADVFEQLPASVWGARYNTACRYLAAHLGVTYLRGSSGAAGPLTQEQVGPMMRSYAAPFHGASSELSEYDSTSYGREFRRLMRLNPARIGLLG